MSNLNTPVKQHVFENKDFGILRVVEKPDGELGFNLEDAARSLGISVEEAAAIVRKENISTVHIPLLDESDISFGDDVL